MIFTVNCSLSVLKGINFDVDGTAWLSKKDMPVGRNDSWLSSHPTGLRSLLNYIKERYDNPEMFITENGCMDTPGEGDNDITRMRYLRDHIAAVSQGDRKISRSNLSARIISLTFSAIEDGCNVVGYTLWSLIDNFEWTDGYTNLFGIHKVDFSSPSRTRTPKSSAKLYKEIIRNNSVALIEDCTWG
ncbi:glycosyl hydrolase, family 1 [Ancylostoma ceylanicum]|uniref:Glycosyl hydrolase, family 1 n=1 Tax=Ancylostoma ceylanicum TaxID=53326 RepID=A0A0D6LI62_9BILA|nr:glycosyl hydrolase, family 1 [Ancylostoma ceylanicum]